MRKQTKIAALVSAAALLAIGASMTSFAAGWDQNHYNATGEWIYTYSDGERAYGEWKKSGNDWYYLNEDTGVMDTDRLVSYEQYYYYVGSDGKRVLGEWRYVDNNDGEEINGVTPGGFWYYFNGTTGRAYGTYEDKDSVTYTIGNYKFRFGSDGRMIPGWVDASDGAYYYIDTVVESDSTYGAGVTGWLNMEPRVGTADEDQDEPYVYYYFDGGKMATGSKYIDKVWYFFNENGILQTSGWKSVTGNLATNSVGSSGNSAYVDANGAKLTGWQYVSDNGVGLGTAVSSDHGSYWFYLDKKGVPFQPGTNPANSVTGTATGSFPGIDGTTTNPVGLAKINGKFYLFDEYGRMLSGLYTVGSVKASIGSGTTLTSGLYYFDNGDHASGGKNGWMITGQTVEIPGEYDAEGTEYCFGKDGRAFTDAIVSNVYYGGTGAKLTAEDDYKEVGLTADTYVFKSKTNTAGTSDTKVADDQTILVNTKGVAQKNRTVSNVDGYKKYYVGKVPSANDIKNAAHVEWILPEAKKAANDTAAAAAAKTWLDTKGNATGYEVVAYIY